MCSSGVGCATAKRPTRGQAVGHEGRASAETLSDWAGGESPTWVGCFDHYGNLALLDM